MNNYQYLLYEVQDRVAYLTLNRPDKRNALNHELVTELKDALIRLENDPDTKVIVLRGSGKAFCAGADLDYLRQLQTNSLGENHRDSIHLMELFRHIYSHRKVVIAQVEGHALAGGCGLVTVCDFAFSVPEAKFGYTEVRIGFIPAIVMIFLIRKLGESRARELLLSGDIISADRAERYNMINRVIPEDEIQGYVHEFATRLCSQNSGTSMEFTKKMIGDLQDLPWKEALNFAAKMNAHARGTDDCKKGIAAFLNKEKITW